MSKDREERNNYESFRDEYSFADYLKRSGYDPRPEALPKYTKLYTIFEDKGRGYSTVLYKSELAGKADLYGISTWGTKEDRPRMRIYFNIHSLEKLYECLGKLLEVERGY